MKEISANIVKFAAEECARQRVIDPLKVWHYVEAWHDAQHTRIQYLIATPEVFGLEHLTGCKALLKLTLRDIQRWAARTERDKNKEGEWRGYFAGVHRFDSPPPQEVAARMESWYVLLPDMTPEEAYKEFEVIHPFKDGNGRVGKIIYNWLKDSLDSPVMPPNFFGEGPA